MSKFKRETKEKLTEIEAEASQIMRDTQTIGIRYAEIDEILARVKSVESKVNAINELLIKLLASRL
jgi:prefoldin subunit 5